VLPRYFLADQVTYIDVPVTRIMELAEKYGHGVDAILNNKCNDNESSQVAKMTTDKGY
jgi:hypothetical protein